MSLAEEEKNSKDIVDFKPQLMMVIQEEKIAKMVMDDLYFPILKVLRKGPMTVKEIEREYNKIAENKKSDKTIYRYLKSLQEADLVKAAGQRVIMGKTATETLFSRTAYAFYLRNESAEFWHTEEGEKMAEVLGTSLSKIMGDREVDIPKFQDFLEKFRLDRIDKLTEILEGSNDTLLEGVSGYDWQKFTLFYNLGGLFAVLLTDESIIDDLRNCFK